MIVRSGGIGDIGIGVGGAAEDRPLVIIFAGVVAEHGRLRREQVGFHILKFVGIKNVVFARGQESRNLGVEAVDAFFGQRIAGEAPRNPVAERNF